MLSRLFFAFALIITSVMACIQCFAAEENSTKHVVSEANPTDIKWKHFQEVLHKGILPEVKVDSFKYDEAVDLYEVIAEGQVFYISKNLKYLVLGSIIELSTMKNLTAERLNSLRRIDFSSLNKDDAIKISSGGKSIAIFTDPDCPYCRKIHGELRKLNAVSIYIFLYPLESIHPDAKRKSISIWCSKDRVRALDDYFSGKPVISEDCANPVERNIQFAKKHNINGTPTIILEDNRVISGYIDAEKLNSLVKEGLRE